MFDSLLELRLRILDACNELPDDAQEATAHAWAGILDLEASSLVQCSGPWPVGATGAAESTPTVARARGREDARLALVIVDQVVAALIRGQLRNDAVGGLCD